MTERFKHTPPHILLRGVAASSKATPSTRAVEAEIWRSIDYVVCALMCAQARLQIVASAIRL
jgi:hypothetical protein